MVTDDGDGTYTLASNLHWATDIVAIAAHNLPERKAASKKGLDGLTPASLSEFQDLLDLGITNMKINVLINGIYSGRETGLTHEFNGKVYDINPNYVANLDARIKACTDAGINTSIVFLVPIRTADPLLRERLIHPDAYLGNYSMANVATETGVEYYTALIDFMAQRYSRPDGEYGRLDQWIIHNEVDAHTDWTHAGEKPVELYTQIYDRSMRLVHYTIRKYDPTAKVFASFTKHFNSKAGSSANFRSKDVLDVLGRLSSKEGDYEWNIGWHSYPANLANASTWNDPASQTRFDFNTPQITPRNLEMIDAYVRQKSLLYNGKKVRTVLLSENGFNSNPDNAGSSEELQAAAIAYFWKKVEDRLPAIENIQYHRWVDFPTEGGILFGLWGNAAGTGSGNFGYKKEGWYVWEAAGTVEQEQIFDPYKSIIGINDWSEVQYSVDTEVTPYRVDMTVADCYASLEDIVVRFNGEQKLPQPDGSLTFYNVASNVAQAYEVRKNGTLLASDTLYITEDTQLTINTPTVTDLNATTNSPTVVEISWSAPDTGEGFVVEVATEGGDFTELARPAAETRSYRHEGLIPGRTYTYRVAILLADGTLSCYGEEVSVTTPVLVVDYRNGDLDKPYNTKIVPILQLRNVSDQPVNVAGLSTRYWFTADDDTPLEVNIDDTLPFADGIIARVVELETPRDGADHYLELSFTLDSLIPAYGSLSDIRAITILTRQPVFDETNDYSYANVAAYVESSTVTLYREGDLIWGQEPGTAVISAQSAAVADQRFSPTETLTGVRLYPNPAVDHAFLSLPVAASEVSSVILLDARGQQVPVSVSPEGRRLRIGFAPLPRGLYFVHLRLNDRPVVQRLHVVR